jgi:hypothetical protein
MSRAIALIKSSHPEPGFAVTAAMTLLAVGVGHRGWSIAGVCAAVLATQLSVGWVNDWLDADRDRMTGRGDKPVASGAISRRTVGIAGLLASAAIPFLGLPFGLAATVCITLVGVFALLYDWPLKSTALSVVPYLVAFGLLPAFVVVALPGHPAPPAWLVAVRTVVRARTRAATPMMVRSTAAAPAPARTERSGTAANVPTMPPEDRRSSAPAPHPAPSVSKWTSPQPATAMSDRPMARRAGSAGVSHHSSMAPAAAKRTGRAQRP